MPARATPLETLIHQLRAGWPPAISSLIAILEDHESYGEFLRLVREFLPERENEILDRPGPSGQVAAFASYFEERYFPLPHYLQWDEVEEYGELTSYIPLIPLGFSYEDYAELIQNGSLGARLMTFFLRHPYGEQGERISLGESCQEEVEVELLRRIPEEGFTPEELHRLLDGTPYQNLAVWGDLINLSTGNDFLDTDEEMMSYSALPEWSRENVDYFTRAWAEAETLRQGPFEMMERFEKEPESYLKEILDFIEKRKEELHGADTEAGI